MPNHYVGDLLLTMAISGHSRVRIELFELTVIPALTPHPVQMHRQLASQGYLRDLPSASQGKMEKLAAPLGMAAHRDLRRFYQQEAQQCVALFADVSQPKSQTEPDTLNSRGWVVIDCAREPPVAWTVK